MSLGISIKPEEDTAADVNNWMGVNYLDQKDIENQQYAIHQLDESKEQKEIRLQLLNKIGLSEYRAWIHNLVFDGSSDYIFLVPSAFHRDILTQKYAHKIKGHTLKFILPSYNKRFH